MPAVPKRKLSKGRRNRRRSHDALRKPHLIPCPQCHTPMRPHHICPSCGSYGGVEVITIEAKEKAR